MDEIVKQNGAGGLPANFLEKMATGIAESRRSTVLGIGGKPLLGMSKAGAWVFGQNKEPVQEGSTWAVNPLSLGHGYCCWKDEGGANTLAGEIMVSMAEPKPAKPDPITGTPYVEQRTFDLRCLTGVDAGTEVKYKTNSYGGLNAVDGILAAMQEHWRIDPAHPCPVLTLASKDYQHKKYGQIFNPVLTIVGWVTMDGSGGEPAPEPKPKPEPAKPAKPKKAPLSVVESAYTLDPELAPAPTQRAHQGQRRRPGT
jgi:hypothetical protein